jgi:hypothetical protein
MLGIILLVGEIKRSDLAEKNGEKKIRLAEKNGEKKDPIGGQKVDNYGSFVSGKSLQSRGCWMAMAIIGSVLVCIFTGNNQLRY